MRSEATNTTHAEACALLADRHVADAIDLLGEAVEQDPDAGQLWSLLGVAHWTAGQVVDSIAALETALTLVPVGPEGRLALALGYEVIQKRALALDLFLGLNREEHLPLRVLEPLSRAFARADRLELALGVCRRAAKQHPDEVGPLRGIAFYLAKLGRDPEEILPVLFQAFHLDPDDFDTRLLLARRLHEAGRSTEAAYLLSIVEIETACCASCLHRMREIFMAACDLENADRCLSTLVALIDDPDNPECPTG